MFTVGDPVVFRVTRYADRPAASAKYVTPSPKGDGYSYVIEKFWVVTEVCDEHQLRVRTRRGKCFQVDDRDPRLRRASWWERCIHRDRFPGLHRRYFGGR